jgi:hypothetical protein
MPGRSTSLESAAVWSAGELLDGGRGVRLFDSTELDLHCVETIQGEGAVHLRYGVQ